MVVATTAAAGNKIIPESGIDWELVIKVVSGGIAAVGGIWKLVQSVRGSRARLAADIEILGKLPVGHPQKPVLERSIQQSIDRLYSPQHRMSGFEVAYGIIVGAGFTVWTVWLMRDGFSWWGVLTGFFAMGGIGVLFGAIDLSERERKSGDRKKKAVAGQSAPGESPETRAGT